MKKLALLPLAALAFAAACAETPTASTPSSALFSHGGGNEVNGPTVVVGTYTKPGAGGTIVNTHPRAGTPQGGSCVGTVWYNPQGHPTSAGFCVASGGTGGGGAPVTCTFESHATFAAHAHDFSSGNQNLNFHETAANGYDAILNPDIFVHYKGNKEGTDAKGSLAFVASCSDGSPEAGTLNLAVFSRPHGAGSPFSTDTSGGTAIGSLDVTGATVQIGGGASYALTGLTWEYRSN